MMGGVAMAVDNVATSSDASATLTDGGFWISTGLGNGDFGTTALTGLAHTLSGVNGFTPFVVTDARGSGVGWTVNAQATQFTDSDESSHTIANDSFTMPLLKVAKTDITGSNVPGTLHAAATIDNALGVQMVSCDAFGQGMGQYSLEAASGVSDWKLAITAHEFAGSYDSTVTLTLATLAL